MADRASNDVVEAAISASIGRCEECGGPAYVDICPEDPWPLCVEHVEELRRRIRSAEEGSPHGLTDLDDVLKQMKRDGL